MEEKVRRHRFRWLPDCLSISRLAGAVALLLLAPGSPAFLALYAFCGLSDMADGTLARALGVTSRAGALLDSVSDVALLAVMLWVYLPTLPLSAPYWLMLALVAAVRLTTLAVGGFRYRSFPWLHTYANKAAGFLLFLFPFLYTLTGFLPAFWCVASVGFLSAVEELAITLRSPVLAPDRKSIFIPAGTKNN